MNTHIEDFYSHGVDDKLWGNYYIHVHQKNIGLMNNGAKQTGASIARKYKYLDDQKKTSRTEAIANAVRTQYLELLKSKINGKDKDSKLMIAKISDQGINKYTEEFIEESNKYIESLLSSKITANYIANSIKNSKNFLWDWGGIDPLLPLQDQDIKTCFSELDKMFTNLLNGVSLLNNQQDPVVEAFYTLLSDTQNDIVNQSSLSTFGADFENSLNKFRNKHKNNKTVEAKAVLNLLDELSIVANRLSTGKTTKNSLTLNSLKSIFDREVFPIGFGETAVGLCQKIVFQDFADVFNPNHLHYTGKNQVKMSLTKENGEYFEPDYEVGTKGSGKTDINMQNFKVNTVVDEEEVKFTLDLGLSVKTYAGKAIFGQEGFGDDFFDLGGGMNIRDAILLITNNNYLRYLGYNAIAQKDNSNYSQAYDEIKKAAFLRSIIYLTGSRNKSDFAQFLFCNGQLVSLWDVINYVIKNIDFLAVKNQKDKGYSFSINEDVKISAINKQNLSYKDRNEEIEDIRTRVSEIHAAINKMSIKGYLRPKVVLESVKKSVLTK